MADWNQPTNASTYTGVLATLNEKIADAAKMDFTGDTNLPVGVKRHDSSSKKFQEWNGTSWVDISVHFGLSVGIGTTSPSQRLHVSDGTSTGDVRVMLGDVTNNVQLIRNGAIDGWIRFTGTDGVVDVANTKALIFRTDSVERMRIQSDGKVGVGTSTPSYNFTAQAGSGTGVAIEARGRASDQAAVILFTEITGIQAGRIQVDPSYVTIQKEGNASIRFVTNGVQRMETTGGGNVGIGLVPSGAVRLHVRSAGTTNATYPLRFENSAGTALFEILSDGGFFTGTAGGSPYNLTTGNAANVHVSSSGVLSRSTSSMKYKHDVQDLGYGLSKVLQTRPVSFIMKGAAESERFAGLIAEDIDALGMPEFVQYADDGSPDALNYANMVALAFNAIKELNAKLESLEAQLAA